jgi:predicted CoA-substrate-specific enzyme activase
MITAGIDVGSATAKAVILEDNKILAYCIIPTGAESAETALEAIETVLEDKSFTLDDIQYIVATGYGRIMVPFANEVITEISCHAKGANWYFPTVRTILDMGGQDCKAIRVDDKGIPVNFAMNDKCAAGTGRFLEVMADVLRVPLAEIGELSLKSKNSLRISSTCAVFARSEVDFLMRRGASKEDILSGLHEAICERVYALVRRVGIEKDFVITGGIAKNAGLVHCLEAKLKLKALVPGEPQIVGAVGAALLAREHGEAQEKIMVRQAMATRSGRSN